MKVLSTNNERPFGIAIFILLISLIVLSFGMSELFLSSNNQASRVRNYGDRVQAVYMARSAQAFARVLILLDSALKSQIPKEQRADQLSDLFLSDSLPFPIPTEIFQLQMAKAQGHNETSAQEKEEVQAFYKKCDDFFGDFQGEAMAKIEDLNATLDLNSIGIPADASNDTHFTLLNLLKPNYEFERSLSARNINPETIVREIHDYLDKDENEFETQGNELNAYTSASLDYGPKNSPMLVTEELKLIPDIDDELYDYLTHYVTGIYFSSTAARRIPSKINLNTIDKNMFQALLKTVSNPEQMAENFVKHRKEKKFTYTDTNWKTALKDNIGLDSDNIRTNLLTGSSDAFKIVTDVEVNHVKLRVEAYVPRPPGTTKPEAVTLMRVSP